MAVVRALYRSLVKSCRVADAAIARIPGAAPSVNRFRERLSQYINDDAQQHQKVHSESDLPWPAGGANPLSYAMMSSEQLGDVSALETVRQVFRSDSGGNINQRIDEGFKCLKEINKAIFALQVCSQWNQLLTAFQSGQVVELGAVLIGDLIRKSESNNSEPGAVFQGGAAVRSELDSIAARARSRFEIGPASGAGWRMDALHAVNHVMFQELGFRKADQEDFYRPESSNLASILASRKGNPIGLSLVFMGVSARLGLDASGANTPHTFMVQVSLQECVPATPSSESSTDDAGGSKALSEHKANRVFVDVFHQGEILSEEQMHRRLAQLNSAQGFHPLQQSIDKLLQPMHPRAVWTRMLTNLLQASRTRQDMDRANYWLGVIQDMPRQTDP